MIGRRVLPSSAKQRYHGAMLRAIIFDCDGVLADTEPLHYRAFQQILDGIVPVPSESDYFLKYVGLTDDAFVRALFAESGRTLDDARRRQIVRDKKQAYRQRIAGGLPLLPGVEEFIRRVAPRWPLAICSGAHRVEIEDLLRPRGLLPLFQFIVSAESVPSSKPAPDGYVLAWRKMSEKLQSLQPDECLAIEDAKHGVTAAKSAGMKVLAVGPNAQRWELSIADGTVAGLAQVSDDQLTSMFT